MGFLKFQTKSGKKYNLLPSHIRGLESVGTDGTRIYASIAGTPIIFTANKPHADVETEVEKALAEESEQSV